MPWIDSAIEAMREIGYDLTTHTSKSLDEIAPGRKTTIGSCPHMCGV